ncbi:MAG: anti-sigma factor [Bacteroidota bacterium]|jgi:anti-sigma-K factor RskA
MTVKTEERHAQLELCIPYVFGRLNPGNRKQFEAHLATGCEQCRAELSGLYEAIALLPLLLRQETPPSGVRERLLGRISSKRPEQPRSERPQQQQQQQREKPVTPSLRPERPWYLYASIIIGILLIISLIIFVNQLVGTTGTQEKKISELQNELQRDQEMVGILQAERVEMIPLAGVVPGAGMYGKVIWDPVKRNALLQTSNLPAEPPGVQYQLWILKEKKYYSVGIFDVTAEKPNTLTMMSLPVGDTKEIEEFSVTAEPKGGSSQPTGVMRLRTVTK